MSCKTKSKQIGDHEYSVTQWPATKSITMKFRLIEAFGASIACLADTSDTKGKKDTTTEDTNALADGLSLLFKNSSPEKLVMLMKECVVGVSCDGTKITNSSFDELFSGDDLIEVYKVFIYTLTVNYSDLMKGQLASRLLAGAKESL